MAGAFSVNKFILPFSPAIPNSCPDESKDASCRGCGHVWNGADESQGRRMFLREDEPGFDFAPATMKFRPQQTFNITQPQLS
jgi:hypothetical protein